MHDIVGVGKGLGMALAVMSPLCQQPEFTSQLALDLGLVIKHSLIVGRYIYILG